jgi:ElaB/YqjD/DUF883 family membrane-anchored ribosome-binding protein
MLGQSTYSRAVSANVADIERRLNSLEQSLERAGRSTAASVSATADDLRESVASGLAGLVDRFRSGSQEAARMSDTAAKVGGDALRRVSDEVQHRPLVILAVAIGVGILLGGALGAAGQHAVEADRSSPRSRRRRR